MDALRSLNPAHRALALVLLAGLVVRLVFGLGNWSVYWPDENIQSLEQAHRLVFGYGLVPWEFDEGARNWVWPGLVAGVLGVGSLLGLEPEGYIGLLRVLLALAGVATAAGVYALARVCGARQDAAVAGAAVFALAGPIVFFGHRPLSETASTLPVVAGLVLAFAATREPWSQHRRARLMLLSGAALLGLAAVLRYQNGVFAAGLVVVLLARRQWRPAAEATAVLAVCLFLLALLDELTWGYWLRSVRQYVEFNVINDGASQFGTAPWSYYLETLWSSMPVLTVLLVGLALAGARRAPALLGLVVVYFVVHSAVGHKELRFILPVLPVLCALAAVGLTAVRERVDHDAGRFVVHAMIVFAFASALQIGDLTRGDLGSTPKDQIASTHYQDVNRLLVEAGGRKDLCGLKIDSAHLFYTGAYAYLHRKVPLFMNPAPPVEAGLYNYTISAPGLGGEVVAADGGVVLSKLSDTCRPVPDFDPTPSVR